MSGHEKMLVVLGAILGGIGAATVFVVLVMLLYVDGVLHVNF